ncbi:MAG: hypothetical protein AAFN93_21745, partial [Bacteroidota bacterium]
MTNSPKTYLMLILTLLAICSKAQDKSLIEPVTQKSPIPVELLTGHRAIFYQHVISKDIFNDRFNFFNISAFEAEYGSNPSNEFVIASFFSYKLSKTLSKPRPILKKNLT